MRDDRPIAWLAKLRDLPNESRAKTLAVAFGVALVCAILVSTAAVLLKPLQQANQERERQRHILEIVERLPGVERLFGRDAGHGVEALVIELSTGNEARGIDPAAYDQRRAAGDPKLSVPIPPGEDIAGLKRRARYATVYLVRQDGDLKLIILPVHGSGYASTLYGFLALDGAAEGIVALSFFEHGETPGMGARVEDPAWLALWPGKKLRDEQGTLRIAVAKGRVDPGSPAAAHEVDGISGATRTGQGVTDLLRYWLGRHGFGPFLDKIRSQGS